MAETTTNPSHSINLVLAAVAYICERHDEMPLVEAAKRLDHHFPGLTVSGFLRAANSSAPPPVNPAAISLAPAKGPSERASATTKPKGKRKNKVKAPIEPQEAPPPKASKAPVAKDVNPPKAPKPVPAHETAEAKAMLSEIHAGGPEGVSIVHLATHLKITPKDARRFIRPLMAKGMIRQEGKTKAARYFPAQQA